MTGLEAVVLEEVDEIGWSKVQEDVLQIEQDGKPEGSLHIPTLRGGARGVCAEQVSHTSYWSPPLPH